MDEEWLASSAGYDSGMEGIEEADSDDSDADSTYAPGNDPLQGIDLLLV